MDHQHNNQNLNRMAVSATLHCLTGCAIGEVLGMIISTIFGWSAFPSIVIAVLLAFLFGYALTMRPLLKHGMNLRKALKLALASDTASIGIMEVTDNAFLLVVPGAIHAGLNTLLFWWSLLTSLVVAFLFAVPLNRYLLSKGKGHALVMAHHKHH